MLVKPCWAKYLILDKTNGLKFLNYWFLNLLNPQLQSMKARIEKPSFHLFPSGAPLQQNE